MGGRTYLAQTQPNGYSCPRGAHRESILPIADVRTGRGFFGRSNRLDLGTNDLKSARCSSVILLRQEGLAVVDGVGQPNFSALSTVGREAIPERSEGAVRTINA